MVGNDKRPQDIPSGEGAKPFRNGDAGIMGPRGRGHPSPGIQQVSGSPGAPQPCFSALASHSLQPASSSPHLPSLRVLGLRWTEGLCPNSKCPLGQVSNPSPHPVEHGAASALLGYSEQRPSWAITTVTAVTRCMPRPPVTRQALGHSHLPLDLAVLFC